MSEQVRVKPSAVVALPESAEADDSALAGPAQVLLSALQAARNAQGEQRLKLAGAMNLLLSRPARPDDREALAHLLIEKLDDEAFHNLYDAGGLSCRAAAVEAVLNLGFPWALHLEPDDLTYLRTVKPARATGPWGAMAIVTGLLVALFALAFYIHL